jgi:glycosyltransferase involved in cell wall biosynthesis
MPEISIITPLYNGAKTLRETAESVIAQDFTDWEWILYDDGSSDNTYDVAKEFLDKFPDKVFYYEHPGKKNFGTSYTRNRAVEKSSGEIIAFIDQDDIWYTNRLSVQLEILKQFADCAMIWGPCLYWYKNREFVQKVGYKSKGLKSGLYNPPDFVEIFLSDIKGNPIPSTALVRRKHYDAIKGYEEAIRGSEDVVLWLKIAAKFKIYFHEDVLVKYRKHQDSTLRIAKESGLMNEWDIGFYKWVNDFLINTSAKKELIDDNEFTFYRCLKRVCSGKDYLSSRIELKKKLNSYPELKKKFMKDYILDLILPFDTATKVSAKIRFDWFKK